MSVALQFMRELYSRCNDDDGYIVIVDSDKDKIVEVYSLSQIELAAKKAVSRRGLYWKVNLMNWPKMHERLRQKREKNRSASIVGNAAEVQTVVSFHLDADAGKGNYHDRQTMLGLLNQMPCKPSMIVNSDGPNGGFHAYWLLEQPYRIESEKDRDLLAALTKRWQKRLKKLTDNKLDSTANIDRVLRVPGSIRSNGNVVSIYQYEPSRRYTLRELSLPPDEAELKRNAVKALSIQVPGIVCSVGDSDDYIREYIASSGITPMTLLKSAGYVELSDDAWLSPTSESGGRSVKIATEKDGVNVFSTNPNNEFACFADGRDPGWRCTTYEMFVALRFEGSIKRAYAWCAEQVEAERNRGVDLRGLENGCR